MEKPTDQNCPFALHTCNIRSEKPEAEKEAETKLKQARLGAPKQVGQMPWSVFEDVYWI